MKVNFPEDKVTIQKYSIENHPVIEIPFHLEFITKKFLVLYFVNIECSLNFEYSIYYGDNAIKLPFVFDKNHHDKKLFKLRMEFEKDFDLNIIYNLNINFEFEFDNGSLFTNLHSFQLSVLDNSILNLIETKKKKKRARYFNMVLISLIFGIFYIWNSLNSDVFKPYIWTNQILIRTIGALILIFLGVEIRQFTKIVFKKFPSTRNFFVNPEFYIEPTLLNILKLKKTVLILFLLFLGTILYTYEYTPMKLPSIDKNIYSFYSDTSEIDLPKVYRINVDDIKIGLKRNVKNTEFKIIPLAHCVQNGCISQTLSFEYLKLYYFINCNLIDNDSYKDTLDIENIIKFPQSHRDSLLLDRINGKQNMISFHADKSAFCENKDNETQNENYKKYKSDVFSPVAVQQLIEDYHSENKPLVKNLWDNSKDVVEFHNLLENQYITNFKEAISNYLGNIKRTTGGDIMICYDGIVNTINTGDLHRPFYEDKPTTTFDKLLQIILLFKMSSERIDCYKICKDFHEYVNILKGKSKINGLGSVSEKVLTLYSYLFTFLQKGEESRNDNIIFSSLYKLIEESKSKENSLPIGKKSDEQSERIEFLRSLYVESAYFDLNISEPIKKLFSENKNSFLTDPSLRSNLKGLRGENNYVKLLDEFQNQFNEK